MYEVMESLGINYMLYEGVIIVLLLVIGGLFGAVIAGGRKEKAEANAATHLGLPARSSLGSGHWTDPRALRAPRGWGRPLKETAEPELPTIGSVRHGQKVTICGAEWTIM